MLLSHFSNKRTRLRFVITHRYFTSSSLFIITQESPPAYQLEKQSSTV